MGHGCRWALGCLRPELCQERPATALSKAIFLPRISGVAQQVCGSAIYQEFPLISLPCSQCVCMAQQREGQFLKGFWDGDASFCNLGGASPVGQPVLTRVQLGARSHNELTSGLGWRGGQQASRKVKLRAGMWDHDVGMGTSCSAAAGEDAQGEWPR